MNDKTLKDVKIPLNVFLETCVLLNDLTGIEIGENNLERLDRLLGAYMGKLDSMVKRDLFTRMKTAATDADKEAARLEYLERVRTERH